MGKSHQKGIDTLLHHKKDELVKPFKVEPCCSHKPKFWVTYCLNSPMSSGGGWMQLEADIHNSGERGQEHALLCGGKVQFFFQGARIINNP